MRCRSFVLTTSVVALALAGCGSDDGSATETRPSEASPPDEEADAEDADAEDADAEEVDAEEADASQPRQDREQPDVEAESLAVDFYPYHPVSLGNAWEYQLRSTNEDLDFGVERLEIVDIQVDGSGKRVTMSRSQTLQGHEWSTDVEYFFDDDGSVAVPYMAAWGGALELEGSLRSGSIEWPSPSDLMAATPRQSRAQVDVYISGTLFWEGDVTSQAVGDGTATVTVPAGTFDTVVLSHTWTFSPTGEGADSVGTSVIHLADGIGVVRAEVSAGGPSSAISELLTYRTD